MDIIRQLTMIHPVDTFLYGADWLLQRAKPQELMCNVCYFVIKEQKFCTPR